MVSPMSGSNPVQREIATLIWPINEFAQLDQDSHLISPEFSAPNSENQFQFKLTQSLNNNPTILPILSYHGPKEEVCFYYRYAILDANEMKHHIRDFSWEYNKSLGNESHFTIYISREQCEQLLVNGSLTVFCEVRSYDVESSLTRPSQIDSFAKLSGNYEALLESGKWTDFTVQIGDKQFRVHKMVLGTRSPVFAAMFEHEDTKEMKEARVVIEDVEVDVFELLIQYIYTGKVDQLRKYADELLVAADKYHLDILKFICEKSLMLHLTAESVCNVLLLADMHSAEQLKSKCIEYIVEYAKEVALTEGWKELANSKRSDLIAKLFEKLANKDESE